MIAPTKMPTGGESMKLPISPPKAAPSVKPRTNLLYKIAVLPDDASDPRRVIQIVDATQDSIFV
jgi:hypothetical protein